jgi:hypothetical protein
MAMLIVVEFILLCNLHQFHFFRKSQRRIGFVPIVDVPYVVEANSMGIRVLSMS